jgi:hypothetical protein
MTGRHYAYYSAPFTSSRTGRRFLGEDVQPYLRGWPETPDMSSAILPFMHEVLRSADVILAWHFFARSGSYQ